MEINNYIFFLDSKYRDSGGNASPIFNLDTPLTLADDNNYFMCKILNIDVPYSFKNISSPDNVIPINFRVTEDSINMNYTLTIQEGNYSILTLLAELNKQLMNFMINVSGFVQHPTFNLSYDVETSLATFNIIPDGGNHYVYLYIYWSQCDIIAEQFGFTYEQDTLLSYYHTNGGNVITSTNYISPNHVNTSPISSLYVRSNNLSQLANNSERLVEQSLSTSNILLRIPVNSSFNTWLLYENNSFEVRLNNKIIDLISYYLTSLTYKTLWLAGIHWKLTIQIREMQPEWIYKMKLLKMEQTAAVNDLQDEKTKLINELKTINDELKNKIKDS